MIFGSVLIGYIVAAIVVGFGIFSIDKWINQNTDMSYMLDADFEYVFVGLFWPFVLPFYLFCFFGDLKKIRADINKKKSIERRDALRLERIKAIESINADIVVDDDGPNRRMEVLTGYQIIDTRPESEQGFCYVCNKKASPYVSYGDGKLINTFSNVKAHEECLMADFDAE